MVNEDANIILTWDKEDLKDIEKARNYFTKLTNQGWLATRRNDKIRRILEFNQKHGKLCFIPLSEGG